MLLPCKQRIVGSIPTGSTRNYMKKLYLDTEFTQLNHEAKLISIALVDENEEYYYAELSDTYEESDCSSFVKEIVLPLLKGGSYLKPYSQVAFELGNWIDDRGSSCILANDAPTWDFPFIHKLLDYYWPSNLSHDKVHLVIPSDELLHELYVKGGLKRHNALDDALALKRYDTKIT